MANPAPGYSITTAYRKSGSWSCGYHTGVDFACPNGTRLVASIAGEIRHRSYGSALGYHQFAISPDPGQPFADGEVFYAHTRTRLADGTRVNVGDFVAESGAEGNVTGPHLHYEYHPSSKNRWGCEPICANPQPTIDHQSSGGGGGGGGDYPPPTSKKVYLSKLKYGQEDSDSVWYLQDVLNRHSIPGGQTLPTTGNYLSETDEEVRLCQRHHIPPEDPVNASYVGPSQANHIFSGSGLTVIDDLNPSPPDTEEPPSGSGKPEAPALMLPDAVWDPITNFPGLRPFTGSAKKITLHTTETGVKPNWEQQQSGIPHLTVDLQTGQRWQHLDFGIAAYTLSGGDYSPNSASGVNIQIEIIGFTADCPHWSQSEYDDLRTILDWLCDNLSIPFQFPYSFAEGTARLTWTLWEPVSGILGHLHAPYNNHSDPRGLRTDLLTGTAPEPEPEPPDMSNYVTRAEWNEFRNEVATILQEMIDLIEP